MGLVGAFVLGFADGNLVGNNVGLMLLQEESSIRLNAMMENDMVKNFIRYLVVATNLI